MSCLNHSKLKTDPKSDFLSLRSGSQHFNSSWFFFLSRDTLFSSFFQSDSGTDRVLMQPRSAFSIRVKWKSKLKRGESFLRTIELKLEGNRTWYAVTIPSGAGIGSQVSKMLQLIILETGVEEILSPVSGPQLRIWDMTSRNERQTVFPAVLCHLARPSSFPCQCLIPFPGCYFQLFLPLHNHDMPNVCKSFQSRSGMS